MGCEVYTETSEYVRVEQKKWVAESVAIVGWGIRAPCIKGDATVHGGVVYNVSSREIKRLYPDVWDVGSTDVADDGTQRVSRRWMDEGDGAWHLEGGAKGWKGQGRTAVAVPASHQIN